MYRYFSSSLVRLVCFVLSFPFHFVYVTQSKTFSEAISFGNAAMNIWNADKSVAEEHFQALCDCMIELCDTEVFDHSYGRMSQPFNAAMKTSRKRTKAAIPALFAMAKKSDAGVTPLYMALNDNPKLFADHVDALMEVMLNKPTFIFALTNVYKLAPDAFDPHVDSLIALLKKYPDQRASVLMVLQPIAGKKPALLKKHISVIADLLESSSTAATAGQVLGALSDDYPKEVAKHWDDLVDAMESVSYAASIMLPIFGKLGRNTKDKKLRTKAVDLLIDNLKNSDQDINKSQALQGLSAIAEKDPDAVLKHLDVIKSMEEHKGEQYVRQAATHLVDTLEGRTVRNLATAIDEQNAKIKAAATSYEDLKKYVDDNVSELKDFIGDVVKKLPIPNELTVVKGKVRNTLQLHFICQVTGEDFVTETKEFKKWVKVGFSAVKLGVSVFRGNDLPEAAMDATKAVYNALKKKDDEEFLKYISEPFLTSNEQDDLINQLRAAKFFENHYYDAQNARWLHNSAKGKEGSSSKKASKSSGKKGAKKSKSRKRSKSRDRSPPTVADPPSSVTLPKKLNTVLERKKGMFKKWNAEMWQWNGKRITVTKGSDGMGKVAVVIEANEILNVRKLDVAVIKKDHAFQITTRKESYELAAPSAGERDAWVAVIEAACS